VLDRSGRRTRPSLTHRGRPPRQRIELSGGPLRWGAGGPPLFQAGAEWAATPPVPTETGHAKVRVRHQTRGELTGPGRAIMGGGRGRRVSSPPGVAPRSWPLTALKIAGRYAPRSGPVAAWKRGLPRRRSGQAARRALTGRDREPVLVTVEQIEAMRRWCPERRDSPWGPPRPCRGQHRLSPKPSDEPRYLFCRGAGSDVSRTGSGRGRAPASALRPPSRERSGCAGPAVMSPERCLDATVDTI
jgi:hypothetical protein